MIALPPITHLRLLIQPDKRWGTTFINIDAMQCIPSDELYEHINNVRRRHGLQLHTLRHSCIIKHVIEDPPRFEPHSPPPVELPSPPGPLDMCPAYQNVRFFFRFFFLDDASWTHACTTHSPMRRVSR